MKKSITVAVLGSTGYVGLELINILSRHSNVKIVFLGSNNFPHKDIRDLDNRIINDTLPKLDLYKNINLTNQILNGRNMGLTSSFTHTRVGFEDIQERYRTGMLRRSSRATGGNGHRFAQALVEVTNRLAANVPEDGYNSYFTSSGNH